jgi:PIN domain nuclease of toxin-antitoxin system
MLNLDTHVLLHALAGSLRPRERALLGRHPWGVSAIVFWEIAKLAQLRRIDLDLDDPEVARVLSRLHVWPLTLDVALAIRRLDFQSDPADAIIAATSLVHRVPLATRDRRIRRSKVVPLAQSSTI